MGKLMRLMSEASAAAALLLILALHAHAGNQQQQAIPTGIDCNAPLPYGEPKVQGTIQKICHPYYTSYYDVNLKGPRLVAYRLTGEQSLGCLPRKSSFHGDEQLPSAARQNPGAYLNTGFDLGHMAPDQDMSWDPSPE